MMLLSSAVTYLLPMVFMAVLGDSAESTSTENEVEESAMNPLYRILARLHSAYKIEDFCQSNPVIHAECDACAFFNLYRPRKECCGDIVSFDVCHNSLAEFIAELKGVHSQENQQRLDLNALFETGYDGDSFPGEEGPMSMEKRYGTVFSKWNWSPAWRRNRSKRYGNVFGRPTSGRKPWWRKSR